MLSCCGCTELESCDLDFVHACVHTKHGVRVHANVNMWTATPPPCASQPRRAHELYQRYAASGRQNQLYNLAQSCRETMLAMLLLLA
jgi:DNA-binding transcriptional regulator YbjK